MFKKSTWLFYILGLQGLSYANEKSSLLMNNQDQEIIVVDTNHSKKHQKYNFADGVQLYLYSENLKQELELHPFFEALFTQNTKKATKLFSTLDQRHPLYQLSNLYISFKNNKTNHFLQTWLELHRAYEQPSQLPSHLYTTLDEVMMKRLSAMLIKYPPYISAENASALNAIRLGMVSKIQDNLQAYLNLHIGDVNIELYNRLENGSPLKYSLSKKLIVEFSEKHQLANAAKVVKEVIGPYIVTNGNLDDKAEYFLMLGRLLYQARAFTESALYFARVPKESKHFISARAEMLWPLLQTNDYATLLGELNSLQAVADQKYVPEIFTVGSIASIQLCQLSSSRQYLNQFARYNQTWLAKPTIADVSEKTKLLRNVANHYEYEYGKISPEILGVLENQENIDKKNMHTLLVHNIRWMRFAKIELLSLARNIAKGDIVTDKIKVSQSALKQNNTIVFPKDDVLWEDELFTFNSATEKLCKRRN